LLSGQEKLTVDVTVVEWIIISQVWHSQTREHYW
jgi:hypothetical protein